MLIVVRSDTLLASEPVEGLDFSPFFGGQLKVSSANYVHQFRLNLKPLVTSWVFRKKRGGAQVFLEIDTDQSETVTADELEVGPAWTILLGT